MTTTKTKLPAAVSWVPPIDPMRGLLGSRTSVAPRPGERRAAPPALRVVREVPRPIPPAPPPPPPPALSCDEDEEPAPLSPEERAARDLANATRRAAYALAGLDPEGLRGRILRALAAVGGEASTGELVLAAWRAWPMTFGLTGCETTAPCSNSVLAKLAGAGGLVGTGYVSRPAVGRYALTGRGRRWCAAVEGRA